jgi:transaldolase
MVKLFLDGADALLENAFNPAISGFTTNPTLMKKAGVTDYESFALKVLLKVTQKPVALEVLSDDFDEMYEQALKISSWGENVNVKIPVMNTAGESSLPLIKKLVRKNININVTAITTIEQVKQLVPVLHWAKYGYISIFAGRIADTGVDPVPSMKKIVSLMKKCPNIEIIWASAREIYNVVQAEECKCHYITIGIDLYKKLPLLGVSLEEMSLRTVKMFNEDGQSFHIR